MSVVKIAIKCQIEHRVAIYTLVTSLIHNKSSETKYQLLLLLEDSANREPFEKIKDFENQNVSISFETEGLRAFEKQGKMIILSWNTIVLGDLSILYDYDLDGKILALSGNDYSVLLLNTDLSIEYYNLKENEVRELPCFYNFFYGKSINQPEKIIKEGAESKNDEFFDLENYALVLRLNKNYSPELFFDTTYENIWVKYYEMSPVKSEFLLRKSGVENEGSFSNIDEDSIPIFIRVSNDNMYKVIGLIDSVKLHKSRERKTDFRLIFDQLSQSNIRILLDENDEKNNVALHCVQKSIPDEILTTSVFAGREKAICIKPGVLLEGDIGEIYDTSLDGNYICAGISNANNKPLICSNRIFEGLKRFDTSISLINVRLWNREDMFSRIKRTKEEKAFKKCPLDEILNILCLRKRKEISSDIQIVYPNTQSGATEYEALLESYVMHNTYGDQIKAKDMLIHRKEAVKMKDTLERLNKIEAEKKALEKTCEQLKQENERLSAEAQRYLYEITETRKSFSYKIGLFITYIPRKIRKKR